MDVESKLRDLSQPLLDIRRTFKFVGTSLLGLGLETVILIGLVEYIGSPVILAKLIGAEASITAMFLLNNRFTYTSNPEKIFRRFIKSNAVRSGGLLISVVILELLVSYGVWYALANIIGVCIGFVFNYGLETLYTWKEHKTE